MPYQLKSMVAAGVDGDGFSIPAGGSIIVQELSPSILEAVQKKLVKSYPGVDQPPGIFDPNTGTVRVKKSGEPAPTGGQTVTGASSGPTQ